METTTASKFSEGARVSVKKLGDLAGSFARRGLAADAIGTVVKAATPAAGQRAFIEVDFGDGDALYIAPSRLRRIK